MLAEPSLSEGPNIEGLGSLAEQSIHTALQVSTLKQPPTSGAELTLSLTVPMDRCPVSFS